MGKEMMSCRWSGYGHSNTWAGVVEGQAFDPRIFVIRPGTDIPEENYPCPPTVIQEKAIKGKAPIQPKAGALRAAVALPDLRIRTATVDPSDPKKVKVEVVNTGPAASAATGVRLWVVPQGKAWYGPVPPLAAGQSAWTAVQTDLAVMTAQKVYARVDDPDKVKELDEGNNGHVVKMTRPCAAEPDGVQKTPHLDYLRGLADRRSLVLLDRIPGLRAPTRARLLQMRRNRREQGNALTLEVAADTDLAFVLREAYAHGEHLERMTIAPPDYAAMVELRNLVVARIDGAKGSARIMICLGFRA